MILRDYQQRAVAEILALDAQGKSSLLISPTGSGKTVTLASIIAEWHRHGLTTLAMAHRRELIGQMARAFGHTARVATWQAQARRPPPYVDRVVVDEAHHIAEGTGYQKLIAELRAVNPRLQVLGATATPWRLDGKELPGFDSHVIAITPAELLARGVLVPYSGFSYEPIDTSGVRKVAGDYNTGQLAAAASTPKLLGNIVERWKATAAHLSTLAFAVNISHAEALCAEFRAQGVTADFLTGKDTEQRRLRLIDDLRTRRLSVLVNIALFTEGLDLPWLECLILARPTLSETLALQLLGRVLRSAPCKQKARINDHAQILQTFGSPYAERDWTPRPDRKKTEVSGGGSQQICVECLALIPATCRVCPECGAELRPAKAIEPGEGIEVEISSDAPPRKRWEPSKIGDSIEGVPDRDFTAPDYVDLTTKLRRIEPGVPVRITYKGNVRTDRGFLMRRFEVSARNETPALSAREIALLAT